MSDSLQPLLTLVHQAIAQSQSSGEGPTVDMRQALSLALLPLVKRHAKAIMYGKGSGLNLVDPDDLTNAGLERLVFPAKPVILRFTGQTEGELVTFVGTVLKRMLIDDQRRLTGRISRKKDAAEDSFKSVHSPTTDEVVGQEEPLSDVEQAGLSAVDVHVPRVYVGLVDEEGNEILKSQNRSVTGYLLLAQKKDHLHQYLEGMPGSVVMVPYGQRSKTQGVKKVKLTAEHARLLQVWMSGEGDDQWKDLAKAMNRPEGTVKRWWSEAVLAFQSDTSRSAVALRDLYRINPSHIRKAEDNDDDALSA